MIGAAEHQRRFTHHPPDANRVRLHEAARLEISTAAARIDDMIPDCREKSLCWTALEEALMWANAAIAREVPDQPVSRETDDHDPFRCELIGCEHRNGTMRIR